MTGTVAVESYPPTSLPQQGCNYGTLTYSTLRVGVSCAPEVTRSSTLSHPGWDWANNMFTHLAHDLVTDVVGITWDHMLHALLSVMHYFQIQELDCRKGMGFCRNLVTCHLRYVCDPISHCCPAAFYWLFTTLYNTDGWCGEQRNKGCQEWDSKTAGFSLDGTVPLPAGGRGTAPRSAGGFTDPGHLDTCPVGILGHLPIWDLFGTIPIS